MARIETNLSSKYFYALHCCFWMTQRDFWANWIHTIETRQADNKHSNTINSDATNAVSGCHLWFSHVKTLSEIVMGGITKNASIMFHDSSRILSLVISCVGVECREKWGKEKVIVVWHYLVRWHSHGAGGAKHGFLNRGHLNDTIEWERAIKNRTSAPFRQNIWKLSTMCSLSKTLSVVAVLNNSRRISTKDHTIGWQTLS